MDRGRFDYGDRDIALHGIPIGDGSTLSQHMFRGASYVGDKTYMKGTIAATLLTTFLSSCVVYTC